MVTRRLKQHAARWNAASVEAAFSPPSTMFSLQPAGCCGREAVNSPLPYGKDHCM